MNTTFGASNYPENGAIIHEEVLCIQKTKLRLGGGGGGGSNCTMVHVAIEASLLVPKINMTLFPHHYQYDFVSSPLSMQADCLALIVTTLVANEIGTYLFGPRLRFLGVMKRVLNYSASLVCTYSFCSHRGVGSCMAVCTQRRWGLYGCLYTEAL